MAEEPDGINTGACGRWVEVADLPERHRPAEGDAEKVAEAEHAIEVATDVLYALSGRQFPGRCSEVVRPCADLRHGYRTHDPALGYPYSMPGWGYGHPVSLTLRRACQHRRACGCSPLPALDLGLRPLISVKRIEVDGEALDPSVYRIDDEREIVRLDGQAWPRCQDLAAAEGEPGSFVVEVTYGIDPPPSGRAAARTMATEVYLAAIGSDECRLPKRVQSVTRQGISMAILDPFEFLDGGRTGLYDVDLFLATANPERLARRPAVLSPDSPRRARRTGTAGPG